MGRLLVYVLLVSVFATCADVSILDTGLQMSADLDGGIDYSAILEIIAVLGIFTTLAMTCFSLPCAVGTPFFIDAAVFSQPGIPQIVRNAVMAQAENHSPFVIRRIRRR